MFCATDRKPLLGQTSIIIITQLLVATLGGSSMGNLGEMPPPPAPILTVEQGTEHSQIKLCITQQVVSYCCNHLLLTHFKPTSISSKQSLTISSRIKRLQK